MEEGYNDFLPPQYIILANLSFTLFHDTVELGYNDISLSGTSSITSDILWYQLLSHS